VVGNDRASSQHVDGFASSENDDPVEDVNDLAAMPIALSPALMVMPSPEFDDAASVHAAPLLMSLPTEAILKSIALNDTQIAVEHEGFGACGRDARRVACPIVEDPGVGDHIEHIAGVKRDARSLGSRS
jgi:hypothetical protein